MLVKLDLFVYWVSVFLLLISMCVCLSIKCICRAFSLCMKFYFLSVWLARARERCYAEQNKLQTTSHTTTNEYSNMLLLKNYECHDCHSIQFTPHTFELNKSFFLIEICGVFFDVWFLFVRLFRWPITCNLALSAYMLYACVLNKNVYREVQQHFDPPRGTTAVAVSRLSLSHSLSVSVEIPINLLCQLICCK